MILISHRGNVDTINLDRENTLEYIDSAIDKGYDVEIDLRKVDDKLYLGHDTPDNAVDYEWLLKRKDKLWIHVKDISAFCFCLNKQLRYFFHENERHTLISNGVIWSHDLNEATEQSIIPLIKDKITKKQLEKYKNVYGICSDYVAHYREIMNN